jgi:RNase P subunit RPR2
MDETYLHRLSRPYRPSARAVRPAAEAPEVAVVANAPRAQWAAVPARRRHVATSCEVCGRTLLAGEQAREIVRGERIVWACPLCIIGSQHARPRAA